MPNYLLEIGTEELPADFVDSAIAQWKINVTKSLEEAFLTTTAIQVYGTPRRLALLIKGLPDKQLDREEEIKGPPASAAFKDGKPTKAAEGFARKQEVDLEALTVRDTDKGAFVFVQKKTIGRTCQSILSELTPQWIFGLEGRRFMRWGNGDLRFPRPIRWLVALLDKDILPIELVNGSTILKSDRISQGHRVLHPEVISIDDADRYLECLNSAYVKVDSIERKQLIQQEAENAAQKLGGVAEISSDLLAEVVNLVEYPSAVIGKFADEFLSLPTEVITTVMVSHQRYFPVKKSADKKSGLLPNFITISNGDPKQSELIAAGNGRVIKARLADAKFFYKTDCEQKLENYLPKLETVTFQKDLGSIRDKVDRIIEVSKKLSQQLNLEAKQQQDVERCALLCKADLVTQMVYEFPELQGIMGEKYAVVSGESELVAQGIFEHYLPRTAEDVFPKTITGQVVGIADRLDTLVSIFGLEMLPTGSSDPFALRRAANSIINITWNANLGINLVILIERCVTDFIAKHPDRTSPNIALSEFFIQRIRTLLQDDLQIDYDLVNAVLGENDPEYRQRALQDLLDVRDRAQFLQLIRNNGTLEKIYETVNRSTRLASKGDLNTQELEPTQFIRPELFAKSSEQAFYDALIQLLPQTKASSEQRNYQLLVEGLVQIAPIVSNFFDGEESVLIMNENPAIQQNRLNLIGLLRNHARVLADFGAIVKTIA